MRLVRHQLAPQGVSDETDGVGEMQKTKMANMMQ